MNDTGLKLSLLQLGSVIGWEVLLLEKQSTKMRPSPMYNEFCLCKAGCNFCPPARSGRVLPGIGLGDPRVSLPPLDILFSD